MRYTIQLLSACTTIAAHAFVDPEASSFMGKAFVPAVPIDAPMSRVKPISKVPLKSGDAAGPASLGNTGTLESMDLKGAQRKNQNFAMTSELQQFRSQIANAAVPQSHANETEFASMKFAGLFGICAAVGAFLYAVVVKLVKASPRRSGIQTQSTSKLNGVELRLPGAGRAADARRFGIPFTTATVAELPPPPQLHAMKTMTVGDETFARDMNFDPEEFAKTLDELNFCRDAEITHARAAIACRRHRPCVLGIFPDSDTGVKTDNILDVANDPNPKELVGFWAVYDDLATEDAEDKLSRGEPCPSMLSTNMVFRADGQTSRGSDFVRGSWQVDSHERQVRFRMTLKAPILREELQYVGTLVKTPSVPQDAPLSEEDEPPSSMEFRVVGQCSRLDVSGEGEPKLLNRSSWSMVKLKVDHTKLIPTIKPWSAPVDPEEVKRQQAYQRELDKVETEDLRELVNDVRKAKLADPDGWMSSFFAPQEIAPIDDGEGLGEDAPPTGDTTS